MAGRGGAKTQKPKWGRELGLSARSVRSDLVITNPTWFSSSLPSAFVLLGKHCRIPVVGNWIFLPR